MRQTLYIHLRDAPPDAPLSFRVDGAATGSVQQAPLADIAEQAQGARLVVVVPSTGIRFLDVALPLRARSRAVAAAPFACEDQLAEDVEALHFAWLGRSEDDRHHFAVITHSRLGALLQRLESAGLRADALVPDCLCLPEPQEGEWVLAPLDADTLLLRRNATQGSQVHAASLPTLLQLAGDAAPGRLRMLQIGGGAELPPVEGFRVDRQPEFGELLDVMVRGLGQQSDPPNLLQGAYAPQKGIARHLRPWREAAALLLLTLLLHIGFQWAEAHRLSTLAEAREAANVARFQQAVPGYREVSPAQLPGFLASEMRRLTQGETGTSLLELLDAYARASAEVSGLSMAGAQWRDGALLLNLRGESLSALEELRAWFDKRPDVLLDVENANASADGVQIRVRLRRA